MVAGSAGGGTEAPPPMALSPLSLELDLEEGGSLHSSTFALEKDERTEAGLVEVRELMARKNISFDEARLELVLNKMAAMMIDVSGLPTDPKAFTFESCKGPGLQPARRAWQGGANISATPAQSISATLSESSAASASTGPLDPSTCPPVQKPKFSEPLEGEGSPKLLSSASSDSWEKAATLPPPETFWTSPDLEAGRRWGPSKLAFEATGLPENAITPKGKAFGSFHPSTPLERAVGRWLGGIPLVNKLMRLPPSAWVWLRFFLLVCAVMFAVLLGATTEGAATVPSMLVEEQGKSGFLQLPP